MSIRAYKRLIEIAMMLLALYLVILIVPAGEDGAAATALIAGAAFFVSRALRWSNRWPIAVFETIALMTFLYVLASR